MSLLKGNIFLNLSSVFPLHRTLLEFDQYKTSYDDIRLSHYPRKQITSNGLLFHTTEAKRQILKYPIKYCFTKNIKPLCAVTTAAYKDCFYNHKSNHGACRKYDTYFGRMTIAQQIKKMQRFITQAFSFRLGCAGNTRKNIKTFNAYWRNLRHFLICHHISRIKASNSFCRIALRIGMSSINIPA